MTHSASTRRALAALVGALVGAAAGFLLTGAFAAFVLDAALDTVDDPAPPPAALLVNAVCAVVGAVVAVRMSRRSRPGPTDRNRSGPSG